MGGLFKQFYFMLLYFDFKLCFWHSLGEQQRCWQQTLTITFFHAKHKNKIRPSNNKLSPCSCHTHTHTQCKLPIEIETTCVRVENLQLDLQVSGHQQSAKSSFSQQPDAVVFTNNATAAAAKPSWPLAGAQVCGSQQQVDGTTDCCELLKSDDRGEQEEANSPRAQQAGSSCDEGMGTCSSSSSSSSSSASNASSAHSSTAGSHCDDRETPPNVAESPEGANSPNSNSASQLSTATVRLHSNSCDNLKLSIDSLNVPQSNETNRTTRKQDKRQRIRSNTLQTGAQLSEELDSCGAATGTGSDANQAPAKRKSRSWSASLSSFGASFKLSASSKATKQVDLTSNSTEKAILFHTDCFCCSTCQEVLVDLRALIYVNEPSAAAAAQTSELTDRKRSPSTEYVNLPNGGELDVAANNNNSKQQQRRKPTETNQATGQKQQVQAQVSLYCHRHFVELFKPRCQQCDCLILDEECTEAEGKSIDFVIRRRLDLCC